jgi:hypothetical protein
MTNLTQASVSAADRPLADWLTEKFFEVYCYAAARIARVLP